MEYKPLPRGWHDASCKFRRALEAAWHAYLEHLGFAPQYLPVPITLPHRNFSPSLWLPEWRAFIYIFAQDATRDDHAAAIIAEARSLPSALPDCDAFVVFGSPDQLETFIEIYSHRSNVLDGGVNRWTIGGSIDKVICMAYFWMLFSADGRAYIPNMPDCFPACYCRQEACELCARIESFLPMEAYGVQFRAAKAAHRISADLSTGCRIAERQRHPWRTHG